MRSVHLVIPDLFLPQHYAAGVSADLRLPALESLLGRGRSEMLAPLGLEQLLCELFAVPVQGDAPIAPISAAFDGLAGKYWMRADPVHLDMQREQMLLAEVSLASAEATELCASLNAHFAGQGMEFCAPHPQRWYVRTDELPDISTMPLSQVIGGDVRRALPSGADAARWHQLFNEIQMLLYAHPLNEAREARGETPVNSVWFWGGGELVAPSQQNFDSVSSDDVLAEMFAAASGVPFMSWPEQWHEPDRDGRQLLVWTGLRTAMQRGDLDAWRSAIQDFESGFAQPLWQALRAGRIAQLQLDIIGAAGMRRVMLTRGDSWALWRRVRRLAGYSLV